MSTTAPHKPGEFGEPPARTGIERGPGYYIGKGLKALASLQLTVVLFALGILLIFFGTLAQLDFGIWTVVDKYFWSWVVHVPFDLLAKFLNVFWKEQFPDGTHWSGTFPFPAGKLLGGLMLVNLLAAHAVRFRLTWKRAGVFLIHGGLLLLFVGEFVTREYAVEQQMVIDEGSSADYAQDIRHVEYVFVDKSAPNVDTVVAIPENVLRRPNGRLTDPNLPVDVEVVGDFMVNAALKEPQPGQKPAADHGVGAAMVVTPQPEVSGLDDKKMNFPAVLLRFYKKGTDESLGTYLASLYVFRLGGFDTVEVDGKKYEAVLRFKRYYKPYRIHLDKFRFDRYVGTSKAKNFSSDVRLFEPGNPDPVRTQRIAMNEPMRYGGETFYQQGFDDTTEKTTILQVVKNPGWLLPYVSCVVVGLGLALHFGIYLVQFLRRGQPARLVDAAAPTTEAPESPGTTAPASSWGVRYLPWICAGVAVLYLGSVLSRMNPPKEPVDFDAADRMPVVEGGRAKPLDTLARVNLRIISGREEVEDGAGKKVSAIQWYLETISRGGPSEHGPVWKYKLVRVDNEQVLQELELKPVEGLRYSLEELWPKRDKIITRGLSAKKKEDAKQKLDQTEVKFKELYERLGRVMDLAASGGPQLPPHQYPAEIAEALRRGGAFGNNPAPQAEEEKWVAVRDYRATAMRESTISGMLAAQAKVLPLIENLTPANEAKVLRTLGVRLDEKKPEERAQLRERLVTFFKADPRTLDGEMRTLWFDAALDLVSEGEASAIRAGMREQYRKWLAAHPAAAAWEDLIDAYRDDKPAEFSRAIGAWRAALAGSVTDQELSRTRVELVLNRFAPFYQCTGLYVLAFVLAVVGFTQQAAQRPHWAGALRRSATCVLVSAFAVHTAALFARMYIMDRPLVFVTNLYASAVFIGWGCVALCLALERIFPLGIGNVLAAILGLATTIVAHNLAVDDTMEMVVAVLDTNFWLATHVTTITLGYTATFVAGFLGALYVLQLLGAVVRDSFRSTGEPTVGDLLAFGAATTGSVAIPLFMLWFLTTALDKYAVVPSFLLWTLFGVTLAVGVLYAIGLMLLRISTEGVDAQGQPLAGRVPGLARPLVALALTPDRGKVFGQMVYGVVCFATLLSFVGTVLGGIWADQSWGRFWGWDPKEVWALITLLVYLVPLHGRFAGWVSTFGLVFWSVACFLSVVMAWYGVNFVLGVGLHSYGFVEGGSQGAMGVILCSVMSLPLGAWWRRKLASLRPAEPVA
ncbi:MAG: cytochrome c biogenesis protein CcsA [Planctomycetes bacterium]|nr:cytochrome c biogenesis protein CcsA [Planctomycetota bacterium]